MSKLFERLPKETPKAYSAFKCFLDLGPERTLKKVSEEMGIKEQRIRVWSASFRWKDRANAWEDYLSNAAQLRAKKILEKDAEKWAHRRVDLREKEYTLAEKLMNAAHEILELPIVERIEEEIDEITGRPLVIVYRPVRTSKRDAAAMLQIGSQLSRLSSEMETSKTKVEVEVTADVNKIEQAREALKKFQQEYIDAVNTAVSIEEKRAAEKALKLLPATVAEIYKVQPEELIESQNIIDMALSEEEPGVDAYWHDKSDVGE